MSRDDIPTLLRGLQYLYITPSLRAGVFSFLDAMLPETVDRTTGDGVVANFSDGGAALELELGLRPSM